MISKEMTIELQRIFQEEFDKKLSFSETNEMGSALMQFSKLLIKMSEENESTNTKGPIIDDK